MMILLHQLIMLTLNYPCTLASHWLYAGRPSALGSSVTERWRHSLTPDVVLSLDVLAVHALERPDVDRDAPRLGVVLARQQRRVVVVVVQVGDRRRTVVETVGRRRRDQHTSARPSHNNVSIAPMAARRDDIDR